MDEPLVLAADIETHFRLDLMHAVCRKVLAIWKRLRLGCTGRVITPRPAIPAVPAWDLTCRAFIILEM